MDCAQSKATPAGSGSADWRELPPDLLRRIFAALFPPPDRPAPLLDLFQQHASLQLTCKTWAAALEDSTYEVSVETCLPPGGSHAWLRKHAAALYFQAPALSEADYTDPQPHSVLGFVRSRIRDEEMAETCASNLRWLRRLSGPPGQRTGQHSYWVAAPPPPSDAPAKDILNWACDADESCMLGHDHLMLLLSQRFRNRREMLQHDYKDPELAATVCRMEQLVPILHMLPACRSLRTLCLDYYCGTHEYVHSFDTKAVVAQLPHLETLTLIGWGETELAGLPPSLRTLVVRGFGFPVSDYGPMLPHPWVFRIPEACRLDTAAVIGYRTKRWRGWDPEQSSVDDAWQLDLPSMWRSCRELLVDAELLCLDGACDGAPLVTRDAVPVLEALSKALGGASPLHRLVIDPDAYWAWDRCLRGCNEDEPAAAAPAQHEAAVDSDEEEYPPRGGDTRLYYAAGLAQLPPETLRQYGLAVRQLAPTRPEARYGALGLGLRECSLLSELLLHASRLPGRYDLEYKFSSLLEVTLADSGEPA